MVWSINDVKQECKSTTGMGFAVVITIHRKIPTSMVPDSVSPHVVSGSGNLRILFQLGQNNWHLPRVFHGCEKSLECTPSVLNCGTGVYFWASRTRRKLLFKTGHLCRKFVLALDLFQGCGQNLSTDGLILIESGGLMFLELIKNGLNPLVENWLSFKLTPYLIEAPLNVFNGERFEVWCPEVVAGRLFIGVVGGQHQR